MLLGAMNAEIDGLAFIGNTLYGVNAASNSLYTLDTVTGDASLVGPFGFSD